MNNGDQHLITEAHQKLEAILEASVKAVREGNSTVIQINPIYAVLILGAAATIIDRNLDKDFQGEERDSFYGDLCFLAGIQDEVLERSISLLQQVMYEAQLARN